MVEATPDAAAAAAATLVMEEEEGHVTGRIVGKRRCSKRLAFYDLRELSGLKLGAFSATAAAAAAAAAAAVAVAAAEVQDSETATPLTAATAAAAAKRQVELVAKAGTRGFPDDAALAAAQKNALKLGMASHTGPYKSPLFSLT